MTKLQAPDKEAIYCGCVRREISASCRCWLLGRGARKWARVRMLLEDGLKEVEGLGRSF